MSKSTAGDVVFLGSAKLDWSLLPRFSVNKMSIETLSARSDARLQVETYCQSLVDAGGAQWWVNDVGENELHMRNGEAYLFGELGVTRLR
jgi:hypothetical protein